jgi:UDP-N-acetylmuramoylalanine--D-glutamate ligase
MNGTLPGLAGRKAVVFGLGKSGLAAVRALLGLGAQVVATDQRERGQLEPFASQALALGASLALGGHPEGLAQGAALVVVSPGVPSSLPALAKALAAGVPRISELELAWRLSRSPWAAITGTNGKTTTTSLLYALFEAAGRPALLGGNIGVALADKTAGLDPSAVVVAEVSSFQLDDMPSFKPRAAVVTNITPDHLDRYPSMQAYVESKAKVAANQGPGDVLVLNQADPYTPLLAERARGQVWAFSRQAEPAQGAFLRSGQLWLRAGGAERALLPADEIGIRGPHNLENAMAAALAGAAMGLPDEAMARGLRGFKGVEHRLEDCGQVGGVLFINDSKGTNVDSVEKALLSFGGPIQLILGGRDKHGDFTALSGLLRERVARVLLLGEASDVIESQLKGVVPMARVADMAEAVRQGYAASPRGGQVLLSPGCASFDMYRSYEHRGQVFKAEVERLRKEAA